MEFEITDRQMELRQEIAEFAQQELTASLPERDRVGVFDRAIWSKIAESGVLAARLPASLGGPGRDVLTTVLALEGLGYGSEDNGIGLAVTGQIWTVQEPILRFGTDHQKERYLTALASGGMIGAHAITEPHSGSDTYAMSTTAFEKDGGYLLNGKKSLIGMAPVCDLALVFAKTDPSLGRWGISVFLVETDNEGVVRSASYEKMGLRTNPIGDLELVDCWVPKTAMLGPAGAGLTISSESLDFERSFIFACEVGAMERQLERSIEYASQREQFGRPIGSFQSVSNRLAEMKLRLDVAKLLMYRAAWLKDSGRSARMESALTKLHISEAFVASSLDAVRIHGGVGYLTGSGIERQLRDSVGGVIYGGTSDIQRQVIARLLGLKGEQL